MYRQTGCKDSATGSITPACFRAGLPVRDRRRGQVLRGHACDLSVLVDATTAVGHGRHRRRQIDVTNKDRRAEICERMAETGEPYAEARRQVIEARPPGRLRPRTRPGVGG